MRLSPIRMLVRKLAESGVFDLYQMHSFGWFLQGDLNDSDDFPRRHLSASCGQSRLGAFAVLITAAAHRTISRRLLALAGDRSQEGCEKRIIKKFEASVVVVPSPCVF